MGSLLLGSVSTDGQISLGLSDFSAVTSFVTVDVSIDSVKQELNKMLSVLASFKAVTKPTFLTYYEQVRVCTMVY